MTWLRRPVILWLVLMLLSGWLVARTRIGADMAAFLPRSPSAAQEVLVDQVQNGVAARLTLLALEGGSPESLAALSRALAKGLAADESFASVNNGEDSAFERDREFFWRNRYLLSPGTRPERFTANGLHDALEHDLDLLRSDLAVLAKRTIAGDPTGELLTLIDEIASERPPNLRDGVWFSRDGNRALLVVETRGTALDTDAQQRALAAIERHFVEAKAAPGSAKEARLLETGPGVFAAHTRAVMEQDATRLSLLAALLVTGVMMLAYRSLRLLLAGLLPVLSGALAGIAAVALGFGFVHGITLGFGVTLIGEAVDYAIYALSQTAPGGSVDQTLARIGPTLRLGMLTSIAGFSAMLFSSFTGFAQLGLFSIIGLIAALGVTRWVLPALLPPRLAGVSSTVLAPVLAALVWHAPRLRPLAAILLLASALLLYFHRGGFWQEDLSGLSPVPAADQTLDQQLRREIGAPDVRYLIAVSAPERQAVLQASEALDAVLERLSGQNALAGFDAPHRYLPSDATQRARQSALPPPALLQANLGEALAGLSYRPEFFAPFLADVARAREEPLLTRETLSPGLRLKLDALLFTRRGGWLAVLPLRGVNDASLIRNSLAGGAAGPAVLVDLKAESDRLLQDYQHEAALLAGIGTLVILGLLALGLRSAGRVFLVAAPLAAAVLVTLALLTLGEQKLSIFHLVGLMLIVAVGSNYGLFFERNVPDREERRRMLASLVLANMCTVIGFGVLMLSRIPVLHDIGATVAPGAFLSLLFPAVLGRMPQGDWSHALGEPTRHPLP